MRYEITTEIAAPTEVVWPIVADVERWPEWTDSVSWTRRLDDDRFDVGSRVRLKQPRLRRTDWEVTKLTPHRGFEWRSKSGGITTVAGHWLEPTDTGTRVSLVLEQAGFLEPLVARLFGGLITRYMQMEADGLKRRAESTTSSSGDT